MFVRTRLAVVVVATALAVPAIAPAHPGHDHKVMGTIDVIAAKHVTITTTDGKELTFEVTDRTKLSRGKMRGFFTELEAGMRVVVNVGDGEEPLVAKALQYSAAPAKKSSR